MLVSTLLACCLDSLTVTGQAQDDEGEKELDGMNAKNDDIEHVCG